MQTIAVKNWLEHTLQSAAWPDTRCLQNCTGMVLETEGQQGAGERKVDPEICWTPSAAIKDDYLPLASAG